MECRRGGCKEARVFADEESDANDNGDGYVFAALGGRWTRYSPMDLYLPSSFSMVTLGFGVTVTCVLCRELGVALLHVDGDGYLDHARSGRAIVDTSLVYVWGFFLISSLFFLSWCGGEVWDPSGASSASFFSRFDVCRGVCWRVVVLYQGSMVFSVVVLLGDLVLSSYDTSLLRFLSKLGRGCLWE